MDASVPIRACLSTTGGVLAQSRSLARRVAGTHSVAVALRLMTPALYYPAVGRRQIVSTTILNAFTLAVACWCAQQPHPPC